MRPKATASVPRTGAGYRRAHDCSLPAAAYATITDDALSIEGRIAAVDGTTVLRHVGIDGAVVARHLLDEGGRDLLGR